ncbi:MAG: CusA/CzcA family heavy metal efflux RND transporter [Phormidesmis sp. CAN_BIN36]|nr:CusA/CzcA family heavy metal efflux RND transporter [Phormidesmis sp. CAN_BIN36]
MLNSIVKWSIAQRWLVVLAAILISLFGLRVLSQMPLDVLPSFAPPQVEIQTEAPGLAPEEVESLVTLPIENAVNGTPGVTTIRSSSAVSLSVVKIIFGWGTDIYQARQLVTERLQQVQGKLPSGVGLPQIAPVTSPIGTIIKYAFTTETSSLMELRRIIDGQVTNRLRAVPGVTQVIVIGGDIRQYQVLVDPEELQAFQVTLAEVTKAVTGSNANAPGGFLSNSNQEMLIRGVGRIESIEQLQQSVIVERNGTPILLSNVAEVKIGAALKRGDASLNGQKAIVMTIDKQPVADTLTVTKAVEAAMTDLRQVLPKDVKVTETFRQGEYIESSIQNVEEALRDGMIIVSVVLILFLMNWRTVIISLSALPVSLLLGLIVLNWAGQGINTMTLGGLAVAIGSVVDDAIVDMENVYRRLRENQLAGTSVPPLQVVFNGSLEVRLSVLFSTVIIVVVFAPILALSGVEGRIFTPMGIAYLLSVLASTVVALTLTPALCALLLTKVRLPEEETWIAKQTQRGYRSILQFALSRPQIILLTAGFALAASLVTLPTLGRVFLPEFQENSIVVATNLYPGVPLETTNRVGFAIADALKDDPQFNTIQYRAGRAPGDSDAGGVNFGEMDIELSDAGAKDREAATEKLRQEFSRLPGVVANVGGFISDRFDEVLSGVRAGIAVKVYGADLEQLRSLGQQVRTVMSNVPGIVDLQLEPQIPIKQVQIKLDRAAAARYSLSAGDLSETITTAFNGRVASQILEQQQLFDLFVWLQPDARQDIQTIQNLLIDTPRGQKIPIAQVAQVGYGIGSNTINREDVSRRLLLSANGRGRDLRSIINELQAKIKQNVQLPSGYFIEYGGQFEAEERATQSLMFFGGLSFVVISVLMYLAVKSISATVMIMANLPLALIGGVLSVALSGGIISVASMVGFITLFGVATRNGLLLVDNYNHKLAAGMPLQKVLVEGSIERLPAILMTALSSAVGLLPLVIGTGAGKEVLHPLAIVVLGGLCTSTLLTLVVIPAAYAQFDRFLIRKHH